MRRQRRHQQNKAGERGRQCCNNEHWKYENQSNMDQ